MEFMLYVLLALVGPFLTLSNRITFGAVVVAIAVSLHFWRLLSRDVN